MNPDIISLRPFIGSKNFRVSKEFYAELGFKEKAISGKMSVFQLDEISFYLQDYYAEEWLNNTMLFFEIKNIQEWYYWLKQLDLEKKYPGVSVRPIRKESWGEECFVLDPGGILLHFGQFYQ